MLYRTNEYKMSLWNVQTILVSLLSCLAIINISFVFTISIWSFRIVMCLCAMVAIMVIWLIYKSIYFQEKTRSKLMWLLWLGIYILLLLALLPITLFFYFQMDWLLFLQYGMKTLYVCYSKTNIIIPMLLLCGATLGYWMAIIMVYNKSYVSYLCLKKIVEIYGK